MSWKGAKLSGKPEATPIDLFHGISKRFETVEPGCRAFPFSHGHRMISGKASREWISRKEGHGDCSFVTSGRLSRPVSFLEKFPPTLTGHPLSFRLQSYEPLFKVIAEAGVSIKQPDQRAVC